MKMEVALSPTQLDSGWGKRLTLDDFVSHSPVEKVPVPNHLTDTKIFSSQIKKDAVIKIEPSVIHFSGFSLRKTQQKKIKICNSSSERQNLHVISPATKYFSVTYTKPRRFVPGFTMDVTINFTPDEWRYYYDCIRLHCEGEENIIIPLHGYPVMDLSGFPEKFVFDTAGSKLGKVRKKIFSLKSQHPVDFEYKINILQSHPSFTVKPLSGTVPGEGEALVTVIYKPTEYATSHMTMQLKVSQFNSQPLLSSVMASCVPNPKKKSVKDFDEVYKKTKMLDPHALSLVHMSRKRRTLTSSAPPPDELEHEGLHFPVKLHTQHAVNSVLMQKAGKLRAKDMRDAVSSKLVSKDGRESTVSLAQMSMRQMKEAAFKQDLTKDEIEERANHLRWQVHTGSKAPTEEEQLEILRERERAQNDYKYRRRCEPDEEAEVQRYSTFKAMRRTFRYGKQIPGVGPSFDLYNDNPWLSKHKALERFQQAARTILIRRRADKKVKMLRIMIEKFRSGNQTPKIGADSTSALQLDVRSTSTPGTPFHRPELVFSLTAAKVKPFTFPVYIPPDTKDSLTTDELGEVTTSASAITMRTNVPFQHLKVPKQYGILGYAPIDVDRAAKSYVSPSIAQPLRSGAMDELIEVSIPPYLLADAQLKANDAIHAEEIESHSGSQASNILEVTRNTNLPTSSDLVMPQGLLKNPPHHPLRIFNPFPGMQRTYLPFYHSEVDPDHHICPIPRSTMVPGAKSYFEKRDTIPEIMLWKTFPPQALIALSQSGAASSETALPRWSDPFSEAMVPIVSPILLPPPSAPDSEFIPDFGGVEGPDITPEMISEEFKVSEGEIFSAAQAEEEEREHKPTEVAKPVKSSRDQLRLKLQNNLKKLESMDKKKARIVYC